MTTITFQDFSGGLNVRDSPNELAKNETPSALNWTLDERGALKVRNGFSAHSTLPGDAGTPAYLFYSTARNQLMVARTSGGALFHLYTWTGAAWTDRGSLTFGTGQIPTFTDWPGSTALVVITAGGETSLGGGGQGPILTWNGAAITTVSASTVRGGYTSALWQNRLWVAGYYDSSTDGNPSTLIYSKIGDPATWAAPDGGTVDLRDKDADRITGMGVAAGALIVFKRRSAYRVYDSSTGAYTMIDPNSGAVGPLAVVPYRGRLYTWGDDGIYEWDGIGPGKLISERITPLILGGSNVTVSPQICGGSWQDRLLFAYTDSTTNDGLLEVDPGNGWAMKHQLSQAQRRVTSFAGSVPSGGASRALYAAVSDGDASRTAFTNSVGVDGTVFTNNYRTPWLQPAVGKLSRIMRAQIEGLLSTSSSNTLAMRVYKDWDLSSNDSYDLTADLRGGDVNDEQEAAILHSLGHSRSFAFEFVAATAAGATAVRSLSVDAIEIEQ